MLHSILNSLFGCSHQRTTFPITPGRKPAQKNAGHTARTATYVVCLDCGKEFAYDWQSMRIGQPVRVPVTTTEAQPVRA
jgi:hypothetical protein